MISCTGCCASSTVALCEVMVSRMGLSPECEQSLLHLCGDNPENLARLTKLARNHGHRFSRYVYVGNVQISPRNSYACVVYI